MKSPQRLSKPPGSRIWPGLLPRTVLVERLVEFMSCPLVLVSASAGFGKTSQAALSLYRRSNPEDFIRGFSGSDRLVAEFLTEKVLAVQDKDISMILLKRAVLGRFCAELSESYFVPAIGLMELTHWIKAANLFLVPLDDEYDW